MVIFFLKTGSLSEGERVNESEKRTDQNLACKRVFPLFSFIIGKLRNKFELGLQQAACLIFHTLISFLASCVFLPVFHFFCLPFSCFTCKLEKYVCIYLSVWLHWVLVLVHGLSLWHVNSQLWHLGSSPLTRITPGPSALRELSFSLWTIREVPYM